MAPQRSGRRTSMLPIKRPPLLPPWMPRCAGDVTLAPDEVFADGDEVVIRPITICLQCRLMPLGTEFAAATDVGNDVDSGFSSQAAPTAGRYDGSIETSNPP